MDKVIEDNLLVSVIMPVYNCQEYVNEAINSILNQTFSNFEFIIIDDSSNDNTFKIIQQYSDKRIKIYKNQENKGISKTLNYGISLAKGKYIARMDADDVSLPNRLITQLDFLEKNKDIILCGSGFQILGTGIKTFFPEDNEKIKLAFFEKNVVAHPTVMIKKAVLDTLKIIYNEEFEPAEDFDLWVRLLDKGKLHNLNKILLYYRVHQKQISHENRENQINKAFDVKLNLLNYLDCEIFENEKKIFKRVTNNSKDIEYLELKIFLNLRDKLLLSNQNLFFDSIKFSDYLYSIEEDAFKNYFIRRRSFKPYLILEFYKIILKSKFKLNLLDQIKFIIKSIIYYNK